MLLKAAKQKEKGKLMSTRKT